MICIQQPAHEGAQRRAVLRVGQGELDERAEVGVDVANVEPALRGRQTESEHAAATLDEQADAVGQLDFAALAGGGVLERVEDLRRQQYRAAIASVLGASAGLGFSTRSSTRNSPSDAGPGRAMP
jgi:hypothetical protein